MTLTKFPLRKFSQTSRFFLAFIKRDATKTSFYKSDHQTIKLRKSCIAMKDIAIKEHHLYNKTFTRGERFVGRYISVHVLADYSAKKRMLAHPQKIYTNRIGLSVTKKIGGAVQRNRAKRVIRAGLRMLRQTENLKTGKLIVISARPTIVGKSSLDICSELEYAFKKLDMLEKRS